MCGIAGAFFVRDRSLVDRLAIRASSCLEHRGPDDADRLDLDEGSMVHRRLSILDTSPAGRQPFGDPGRNQWLIHNGEIYNYLELRQELGALGHAFHTNTDTEVILAAYRAWGPSAVEHFNGIWAFALWDGTAGHLLLSRDRLGVKPMYLVELDGGIAFASEIKALLDVAPSRSPNLSAIRDYLWHGFVDHGDETFFKAIRPLPPATNLVVGPRRRQQRRYWSITELSDDADPRPRAEDRLRLEAVGHLLTDAIRLQLRSDVALGTCLSGGLDSSVIAAEASRLVVSTSDEHRAAPRLAVTAGFPGSIADETSSAAITAERAGLRHVVVNPDPGPMIPMLKALLREQDEPFISSSIFAQRCVMEAARREGVKVMLDGQGADELLAGYPHYRYPWLLGLARARPTALPSALRSARGFGLSPVVALRQAALAQLQLGSTGIAPIGRASRVPSWLGPDLRRSRPVPLRDANDVSPAGTPLARHLRRAVLSTSLPALLRYEDRNSMRFSIEARVPYLDHRLVEAAMRLPDRLKLSRGVTKVALREVSRGLIPESIRMSRVKVGFMTPQAGWLARDAESVRSMLRGSKLAQAGFIRPEALEELWAEGSSDELWRVLSLELWLHERVLRAPDAAPRDEAPPAAMAPGDEVRSRTGGPPVSTG
jgi:asparagine synthase (glutamine-hydrolysing)